MSLIKIMHKVDKIPFLCPLCNNKIQRVIKENNSFDINTNGEVSSMENTFYEDSLECTICHENLDDVVQYNRGTGEYQLYTKGTNLLIKDKMEKMLSDNPFGREM